MKIEAKGGAKGQAESESGSVTDPLKVGRLGGARVENSGRDPKKGGTNEATGGQKGSQKGAQGPKMAPKRVKKDDKMAPKRLQNEMWRPFGGILALGRKRDAKNI